LRDRVRDFIQTMIESELEAVLSRPRYARRPKADPENNGGRGIAGHRHGHRSRSLLGTFGRVEIAVPRARLDTAEGKTTEWKSTALRAYQRRTKQADSLIAGAYLAGTNTRRVRRALAAVFGGAVSKDTVSRVWRKVQADWDAWALSRQLYRARIESQGSPSVMPLRRHLATLRSLRPGRSAVWIGR
jgi:transposase-like protein